MLWLLGGCRQIKLPRMVLNKICRDIDSFFGRKKYWTVFFHFRSEYGNEDSQQKEVAARDKKKSELGCAVLPNRKDGSMPPTPELLARLTDACTALDAAPCARVRFGVCCVRRVGEKRRPARFPRGVAPAPGVVGGSVCVGAVWHRERCIPPWEMREDVPVRWGSWCVHHR